MNYIKVKDKNNLEREVGSNGIVNTDNENYQKYLETYRQKYQERKRLESLENQVQDMRADLSDIKNLLLKIVENESK